MLAEMTGIPTAAWGFLWIGIALLVCAWLLRWVARRMEAEIPEAEPEAA